MTAGKPLLIGQAPSRSAAGLPPFSGPRGSGAFLAALLGESLDDFLAEVEAVNLLPEFPGKQRLGKGDLFPAAAARIAAARLLPKLEGRRAVLAGLGVAKAFGLRSGLLEVAPLGGGLALTFPHPSGINRFWNCPRSRRRAAAALRDFLRARKNPAPRGAGLTG